VAIVEQYLARPSTDSRHNISDSISSNIDDANSPQFLLQAMRQPVFLSRQTGYADHVAKKSAHRFTIRRGKAQLHSECLLVTP
jgi:hypothetical protein